MSKDQFWNWLLSRGKTDAGLAFVTSGISWEAFERMIREMREEKRITWRAERGIIVLRARVTI